jgi:hypothetical protein
MIDYKEREVLAYKGIALDRTGMTLFEKTKIRGKT